MIPFETPNTGKTCAMPWASAQPATAYATATLSTLRRFSSAKKLRASISLRWLADKPGEARIFSKRIPQWIETKIGRSDSSRHFKKMRKCCYRRIKIAKARLNLCKRSQSPRLVHRIHVIVFDRTLRLLKSFCLFSKPGISKRKCVRCAVRVGRNGSIRFRFNRFDSAKETSTRVFFAARPLLTIAKLNQSELGNRVERLSRWNRA